jgi:hypothetical protein
VLLDRTLSREPWLRWLVVVAAVPAVAGLLATPRLRRLERRVLGGVAVAAVVGCLAGPAAYAAQTLTTAHTGSVPSAGSSFGGAGGLPGGAAGGSRPAGSLTGSLAGGASAGRPAAAGALGAGGQTQTSAALVKALDAGAGRYRWVAAVSGSQSAATLELATGGDPVMAIAGGSGGYSASSITSWVKAHYRSVTIGARRSTTCRRPNKVAIQSTRGVTHV